MNRRSVLAGTGAVAAVTLIGRRARADDAPPAPLGDPPPLQVFAETPLIHEIALSPDGNRVAFVTQKGDKNFLGYFDVADPKAKTYAIGAGKIRNLFFADASHVVVVDSVTDVLPQFAGWKNEFLLAQIVDIEQPAMSQLFGRMDDFYNIIEGNLGRIKVGGEYRVTASSYKMTGDYDLSLFSFSLSGHGTPHEIDEGTRFTEGWVMTAGGVPVAYSDFRDEGNEGQKTWALYFNTALTTSPHYKKIYSVKGAKHYPDLIGLGRDGKSVVIAVKNTDDDGYDYHEISADGVVSEPIDTKGRDLERSPLFHPTTRRLAGFTTHNDWITYDYFDPLMKKLMDAVAESVGEDYRFSIADFAEDPRKMIVYGESPTDPGSYFYIDFSTGATKVIASNYPDLPEQWVTQKTAISYKAADGLEIHGYLTLPPGRPAKDLPLIVLPHGGPWARDSIEFDWETQAFASRGYAVLQPNFRGSTGYGIDFEKAGYGQWGRKMQSDLSDGIGWLAAKGTVNPKRVAIYGASYGGYAALAGATLEKAGTYTCAVSVAGVSDISSMMDFWAGKTSEGDESHSVFIQKEMLGDSKSYNDISPARQAAKAYCPILMIHGTDDTVVPIDQSQRMERALKAAGKDVQLITFQHQTHWEDIPSSRLAMIQAAMDFIQKYNPAVPAIGKA